MSSGSCNTNSHRQLEVASRMPPEAAQNNRWGFVPGGHGGIGADGPHSQLAPRSAQWGHCGGSPVGVAESGPPGYASWGGYNSRDPEGTLSQLTSRSTQWGACGGSPVGVAESGPPNYAGWGGHSSREDARDGRVSSMRMGLGAVGQVDCQDAQGDAMRYAMSGGGQAANLVVPPPGLWGNAYGNASAPPGLSHYGAAFGSGAPGRGSMSGARPWTNMTDFSSVSPEQLHLESDGHSNVDSLVSWTRRPSGGPKTAQVGGRAFEEATRHRQNDKHSGRKKNMDF